MYSKKWGVYKLHAGWFINRTPGEFINWGLFYLIERFSLWKSCRKRGKFNTKVLAARQFISPTQAPWPSAASEGLQDRKKNTIHQIFTQSKKGNSVLKSGSQWDPPNRHGLTSFPSSSAPPKFAPWLQHRSCLPIQQLVLCRRGPMQMEKIQYIKYCRDQNYSGSGKMFPGINFWKITDFFCGMGPVWNQLSFPVGFAPLAGQITGIGLKAINSSKKVVKIIGPALFRINSVVISARTVFTLSNFPQTL